MSVPRSNVDAVFVYGTLKRGQCRAGMWQESPHRIDDAWVRGELYGRVDYPALLPGGFKVRGEMWRFGRQQMPVVLKVLDQIEGTTDNAVDDLYHRVIIDAFDPAGEPLGVAYTYRYNRDVDADGFHRVAAEDGFQVWPTP